VLWYLKNALGLTVEDARSDHNYALRGAVISKHLDTARFLISNFELTRADIACNNYEALEVAVHSGNLSFTKHLVETFCIDKDEESLTILAHVLTNAAYVGHAQILEYLAETLHPLVMNLKLPERDHGILICALQSFAVDHPIVGAQILAMYQHQ